jgi:glucokinase
MTGTLTSASSRDFVVGIDLGGTKIRAGLATSAGTIIAETRVATHVLGRGVAEQLATVVANLVTQAGLNPEQIAVTGIGGAGVPDSSGSAFELAPNLADLDHSFVSELSERLGHPVVLDNDVNVAAMGELHHGLGLAHRDFVFVSIGTGIGMGIIANGGVVRGGRGAAGEIGFLPFGADPLDAANHVRGPLEEVTAGDAIVQRYADATTRRVSTEEVFALAAAGDPAAQASVDTEAQWIARALVAVNAVLDPEVFVLGGGIGSRPDLLPLLERWLERYGVILDLRTSELGHRAPVLGAIQLALTVFHSNQKGTTP